MAIEHALIKKGSIVSLGCATFISFLSLISCVASISSLKVKNGIESASVIVFVIAFFIPVIFFTWSSSVIPLSGAILGAPAQFDGAETGA